MGPERFRYSDLKEAVWNLRARRFESPWGWKMRGEMRFCDLQSRGIVAVIELRASLDSECGRCRHTSGVGAGLRIRVGMRKIGS